MGAANSASDHPRSPANLIARTVWLEISRREEYFALLILMGLYLVFAIGARLVGNTQPEAVALMLNMGLWFSATLSALLTLVTSVRLIPAEIEARTLYPLLAKPVTRGEVVLGKFLAVSSAGCLCLLVFTALTSLTWAAEFPMPGQDMLLFAQAFILQAAALALLGSLAMLLSLLAPKAPAMLVAGFLYFAGTSALNVLRSAVGSSSLANGIDWTLNYIPHFSKLCLFQRFTDGASALPWSDFGALLLHALLTTFLLLTLAARAFERRVI